MDPTQTSRRDRDGSNHNEFNSLRVRQEQHSMHRRGQYPEDVRFGYVGTSHRRNDTEGQLHGYHAISASSTGHARSHAGRIHINEVPTHHMGSQNVSHLYEPIFVDELVQRTGSLNVRNTSTPTREVASTTTEIQHLTNANEYLRSQRNGWSPEGRLRKLVRDNERLRRELSQQRQQQYEYDTDTTDA
ncbi:hypothetical protein PMIN01_13024 [Paraphaeosphaeria minitans]|uniref:Uncharacterized protein n=1 Tax=Paraphaeosphaeria minitans TaxID=565426 RepID=A0A9P6G7U5_9PLEO|nr:hypothetical protein PMIN01_13024 [Paraphaeosphaeria minitans]